MFQVINDSIQYHEYLLFHTSNRICSDVMVHGAVIHLGLQLLVATMLLSLNPPSPHWLG